MNTPRSVELSITNRCNLNCAYCFHFESALDTGKDLPAEAWLSFFQELNSCAVLNVILAGGEPFIRSDLQELIGGIVSNRMRFSILTNGTLVTDEIAAYIASTGRCDIVQVSIDGSWPGPHDVFRGQGNFERAVAGLHKLRTHGVSVTVRVTIHRHNVDDLEAIAEFLLDEIGLDSFWTNSAGYIGQCRSHSSEVQLTIEERSRAMETLLRLSERYQGRIFAQAGPLSEATTWLKMVAAMREGREGFAECGFLRSCRGFFSKLAVRADGMMLPCSLISHIELGRIGEVALREVWQTHPEMKRLRQRRDISLAEFEFCKDCPYIPYCKGNCPALAYMLTGEDNHPSPDACLLRFLEAGGRLPELNKQSD